MIWAHGEHCAHKQSTTNNKKYIRRNQIVGKQTTQTNTRKKTEKQKKNIDKAHTHTCGEAATNENSLDSNNAKCEN